MQALEHEFELLARETENNESMDHSNDMSYPEENQTTQHLINSINSSNPNDRTAQYSTKYTRNIHTNEQFEPQKKFNTYSAWNINGKQQLDRTNSERTDHTQQYIGKSNQLMKPLNRTRNSGQHIVTCFRCGQHGHIARFCNNFDLKE